MAGFEFFLPITKVDAQKRLVFGVAASETPDKSKEVFDYASSKGNFEKWSGEISKATGGKSQGNLRAMHQPIAAGRIEHLDYDDANKVIAIAAKVVDDNEWKKVEEGVYTGFSIGGKYAKRWTDPNNVELRRYTAIPTEISIVDNACNPDATFDMVKMDGTVEQRTFKKDAGPTGTAVDNLAPQTRLEPPGPRENQSSDLMMAAKDASPVTTMPTGSTGGPSLDTVQAPTGGANPKPAQIAPRGGVGDGGIYDKAAGPKTKEKGGKKDAEIEKDDGGNVTWTDQNGSHSEPPYYQQNNGLHNESANKPVGPSEPGNAGASDSVTVLDAPTPRQGGKPIGNTDYSGEANDGLSGASGGGTAVYTPAANGGVAPLPGSGTAYDAKKGAPQDKDGVEQRWVAKDGSLHLKKDQAMAKNAEIDAAAAVRAAALPALDIVAEIEAKLGKADEGAKPYGDVKYADPGYQADGKHRYPVDTTDHIRAAWSYINKAKNAAAYSADQLGKVKGTIVSAWKDKIDSKGPPAAAEKAMSTEDLVKSLYDVGTISDMISMLRCLYENLRWEAMCEGDNSPMPGKIMAIIEQLCDALRSLVEEETSELADSLSDNDDVQRAVRHVAGDIAKAIGKAGLEKLTPVAEQLGEIAKTVRPGKEQRRLDTALDAVTKAMHCPGCPDHAKQELPNIAAHLNATGAKGKKQKNAVVDTSDNAEHDAPQGTPDAAGKLKTHATQDTSGNSEHAAPTKGSGDPTGSAGFNDQGKTKNDPRGGALPNIAGTLNRAGKGRKAAKFVIGQLAKADNAGALLKIAFAAIDKLPREGNEALQAAHAGLVKAMTPPEETPEEIAAKAAANTDLQKMVAERDQLVEQNATLNKALETVTGRLSDISERLTKIEAEPIPAKTAGPGAASLPAGVHAVEKTADGGSATKPAMTDEEITAHIGKLSKAEIDNLLVKAALRNPMAAVPGMPVGRTM